METIDATVYTLNGWGAGAVLKVTSARDKEADVYTARITLSFDAAMKGNMLTPYQEPSLIFPATQTQAKNISGSILEVTDRRTISGQVDVVYLNRGKEDGVAPGDRFTVYGEPNRETGVTRAIGEVHGQRFDLVDAAVHQQRVQRFVHVFEGVLFLYSIERPDDFALQAGALLAQLGEGGAK